LNPPEGGESLNFFSRREEICFTSFDLMPFSPISQSKQMSLQAPVIWFLVRLQLLLLLTQEFFFVYFVVSLNFLFLVSFAV
jgi:hypothetical protein